MVQSSGKEWERVCNNFILVDRARVIVDSKLNLRRNWNTTETRGFRFSNTKNIGSVILAQLKIRMDIEKNFMGQKYKWPFFYLGSVIHKGGDIEVNVGRGTRM